MKGSDHRCSRIASATLQFASVTLRHSGSDSAATLDDDHLYNTMPLHALHYSILWLSAGYIVFSARGSDSVSQSCVGPTSHIVTLDTFTWQLDWNQYALSETEEGITGEESSDSSPQFVAGNLKSRTENDVGFDIAYFDINIAVQLKEMLAICVDC
ncbi:hypothetical protein NEOLEDRAFT_1151041 [Neolentinus lepideus HHB14362 ss-1]|uniref:Uncharacterized protein n=1 Tax=Neolentinus lepideus HHB14362 ss-1 TaxID=1314782 RepID=A0A165PF41_9AGAM|nr:hypothetical protein NEOLEDRAFT_1151041 [Neolentinus lepideus HHB14362 ss-1]